MVTANTEKMVTDIALLKKDVSYMKNRIDEINDKLDNSYVTKIEFEPIKKVVYGLVSSGLLAILTAVYALVIK